MSIFYFLLQYYCRFLTHPVDFAFCVLEWTIVANATNVQDQSVRRFLIKNVESRVDLSQVCYYNPFHWASKSQSQKVPQILHTRWPAD